MSVATVYSTLELLKELGEIQELSIRKRGRACFDANPHLHHHLLCRKCGKILNIEIDYPSGCPIIAKEGEMDVKLRKSRHTFMEYAQSVRKVRVRKEDNQKVLLLLMETGRAFRTFTIKERGEEEHICNFILTIS